MLVSEHRPDRGEEVEDVGDAVEQLRGKGHLCRIELAQPQDRKHVGDKHSEQAARFVAIDSMLIVGGA